MPLARDIWTPFKAGKLLLPSEIQVMEGKESLAKLSQEVSDALKQIVKNP